MTTETLTADEVRALLRRKCEEAGGQQAFADKAGVTPQYVNYAINGHRNPAGAIAAALGLRMVLRWERLDKGNRRV